MNNLPPGWDLDYDGTRWFYKYRSTGLIQYTFPQEGDEFPDFVDASAPAPALAPEERLESQQQVRRRGDTGGGYGRKSRAPEMSATGGPVSTTWDDDDDGEDGYFQPENFMFLGPGPYNDVSPMVDDGDSVAGRSTGKDVSPAASKVSPDDTSDRAKASPPVSSTSTPQLSIITPAETPGLDEARPVVDHAVLSVDTPPPSIIVPVEPQADPVLPSGAAIPESHERPQELPAAPRFDPVGIVAEMPTELTAAAHIELHPDPVEMPDNTVLAPIETFYLNSGISNGGIAELPTHNSPVDRREPEPPPPRRRTVSQPVQRVYPFQPTEDDDPNRPPTPLGPAPVPTPSPQPSVNATAQEQDRSITPFTPSRGPTPVPAQPMAKDQNTSPATQGLESNSDPRSATPQESFKITRKPTKAGLQSGFKPWAPGSESPHPPKGQDSGPAGAPSGELLSVHAPGSGAQAADVPPPVPAKDNPPTIGRDARQPLPPLNPGSPAHAQVSPSPPSVPRSIALGRSPSLATSPSSNPQVPQRPHSNSLPGSARPPAAIVQQWKGVPLALQPGTPPATPPVLKEKGKRKVQVTLSPLALGRRVTSQPSSAPGSSPIAQAPGLQRAPATDPGPSIVMSSPLPPPGNTTPGQSLPTPSPLDIHGGPPSKQPNPAISAASPSTTSPLAVPGRYFNSQGQVQHQRAHSSGSAGADSSAQVQSAAVQGQPIQNGASGSYFPPQPSVEDRSAPQALGSEGPDTRSRLAEQPAPPTEGQQSKCTIAPTIDASPQGLSAPRPSSGSPSRMDKSKGPQSSDGPVEPSPQLPPRSQASAQLAEPSLQLPPRPQSSAEPSEPKPQLPKRFPFGMKPSAPQPQQQHPVTLRRPQPLVASKPEPLDEASMGHFLHPITEHPEHEDAASLARKASLMSQKSSHRHSMPAMPAGHGSTQNSTASFTHGTGTAISSPAPQQSASSGTSANGFQPFSPQQPVQGAQGRSSFQGHPSPGMYPNPAVPFAGTGPPAAQAVEKGKSKWFTKFLKSSKTPQKQSPSPQHQQQQLQHQQQQQQMWGIPQGLVIPQAQSPAPGPWSPGSFGPTPSFSPANAQGGYIFPPPGVTPQQQGASMGFQPMTPEQMNQRQASGGQAVPGVGPQGQQPSTVGLNKVASQPSQPNQGNSPSQAPVDSAKANQTVQASQSQAELNMTPPSNQNTAQVGPSVAFQQAQPLSDPGPARTESMRSGPMRTESVRSDLTSISAADVSEAQAQPVLKPQIVQVTRPSNQRHSQPPPQNGLPRPYASTSAAPQVLYQPLDPNLNLQQNGQPVKKHDSLRVAPLHVQKRLSAEGPDLGGSARESMVSEVSTASADSRRVSVLSTGPVVPRQKAVGAGDMEWKRGRWA